MLPPGHTAAGFLVATAVTHFLFPNLAPHQTNTLLALGAFCGFAPDLDMFYSFWKNRGLTIHDPKTYHRGYLPHAPLFWLVLAILIFLVRHDNFGTALALTVWLGSWSHFVLDSFNIGIRWFWPASNNYFSFCYPEEKAFPETKNPFAFWWWFVKAYATEPTYRPTFVLELIILCTAALLLM